MTEGDILYILIFFLASLRFFFPFFHVKHLILVILKAAVHVQIMIDNLRSAWTGSRSLLHFKVHLIRSRAEHRNTGTEKENGGDGTRGRMRRACSWLSAVERKRRCCQLLWSVCGQPGRMQTPLQQEPFIENAGDGTHGFWLKSLLRENNSPASKGAGSRQQQGWGTDRGWRGGGGGLK